MHTRAIETRYKGYRFRSRLEARWAVFFDALGLKWEYEPEGFELPSGRYLPDFFIHWEGPKSPRMRQWATVGYWVEIKGALPTVGELGKLAELSAVSKHRAYLLAGPVGEQRIWSSHAAAMGEVTPPHLKWTAFIDCCSKRRLEFAEVDAAVEAARGARFEHGENGARK